MALPNEIHPFQIAGAGQGYQVANSLRFRRSNNNYLSRTPGAASNRSTWTYSVWLKKTTNAPASTQNIFSAYSALADATYFHAYFNTDDTLYVDLYTTRLRLSKQVFRDPSAWYHFVFAMDTTQATAANRFRVYVNGSEITNWTTNNAPTQNAVYAVNNNVAHGIGYDPYGGTTNYIFDGYMTEINLIDGLQLTPSYFGQTDIITGQWKPIKYTGVYGTNGFYLPFNDATSTTTLGYDRQLGMTDSSKNNWTLNNISVTSGTTYDVMRDSPTPYNDGTNIYNRGNYCTMNPINAGTYAAAGEGGLKATFSSGSAASIISGTIAVSSGKWYWEAYVVAKNNATYPTIGILPTTTNIVNGTSADLGSGGINGICIRGDGTKQGGGAYGSALTAGMIVGFALDMDAGTLVVYENNVSQGTLATGLTGSYYPAAGSYNSSDVIFNFGQKTFTYTPPTGYKALNTYNLANPSLPLT